MTDDETNQTLDDLLSRWHHWQNGYQVTRGFNDRSAVSGDFRVSRQYDDENGALDYEIENDIMRTVDFCISELEDQLRWTIQVLARALSLGYAVFTSPRIPQDRELRNELLRRARATLIERLVRAGVM